MAVILIEAYQAVPFLAKLRETYAVTSAKRKRAAFNQLTKALKTLGLVDSKHSITFIGEGCGPDGSHQMIIQTEGINT